MGGETEERREEREREREKDGDDEAIGGEEERKSDPEILPLLFQLRLPSVSKCSWQM